MKWQSQKKSGFLEKTHTSSGRIPSEKGYRFYVDELLKDDNISKEDFICITRRYTLKLISLAEQCIKLYREFLNNTLSEEQLINDMTPLNNEISKWYFKQSNLPIPQTDLHEWADAHEKISGTIHDFSLFYNKKHLDVWPSDNRKWQMANVIKRYEKELEELKSIDKQV